MLPYADQVFHTEFLQLLTQSAAVGKVYCTPFCQALEPMGENAMRVTHIISQPLQGETGLCITTICMPISEGREKELSNAKVELRASVSEYRQPCKWNTVLSTPLNRGKHGLTQNRWDTIFPDQANAGLCCDGGQNLHNRCGISSKCSWQWKGSLLKGKNIFKKYLKQSGKQSWLYSRS